MAIFGRSFPFSRTRVHRLTPSRLSLTAAAFIATQAKTSPLKGTTSVAGKTAVGFKSVAVATIPQGLPAAKTAITTTGTIGSVIPLALAMQSQIFPQMRAGMVLYRYMSGSTSISVKPKGKVAALLNGLFGKTSIDISGSIKGNYVLPIATRSLLSAHAVAVGLFSSLLNAASATSLVTRAKAGPSGRAALAGITSLETKASSVLPGAAQFIVRMFIKIRGFASSAGIVQISGAATLQTDGQAHLGAKTPLGGRTSTRTIASVSVVGVINTVALIARAFVTALGFGSVGASSTLSSTTQWQVKTNLGLPTLMKGLQARAKVVTADLRASTLGSMALVARAFVATQASALSAYTGTLQVQAGSFLRSIASATRLKFFANTQTPPPVSASAIYPRLISIRRVRHVAGIEDQIGFVGYSGETASTDAFAANGEDILIGGIPASIQPRQSGRKKDGTLPQDAVFAATWFIFVPKNALAKGFVRDRDIVVDDEGYRYEVAQAAWNLLGYKLVCIRLEA
jgi:hypothetical protein